MKELKIYQTNPHDKYRIYNKVLIPNEIDEKVLQMKLDIVLEEEDGTFSVHCPALKGCHSQGATKDEAIRNIQEAIDLYLDVAHEKQENRAQAPG